MRHLSSLLFSTIIFLAAFHDKAMAVGAPEERHNKPLFTIPMSKDDAGRFKEAIRVHRDNHSDATPRNRIDGAFGRKLGSFHNPGKYAKKRIQQWKFKPSPKSPYFEHYYLWTSPLSKTTIGIAALSNPISLTSCVKQARELMGILKTKYPRASTVPIVGSVMFTKKHETSDKYLAHHLKLYNLNRFIEVSCLADIPITLDKHLTTNPKLRASDACYSNKTEKRYVSTLASISSPVFSRIYVHHRYKKSSLFFSGGIIHGYVYNGKKYYPAPNSWFRNWKIPPCADVRLAIRYGSKTLEALAGKEYKTIQTRRILQDGKAKGL